MAPDRTDISDHADLKRRYADAQPPLSRPRSSSLARTGNRLAVATFVLLAAMIGCAVTGLWRPPEPAWWAVILGGSFGLTVVQVVSQRRDRREVIRHQGRLCLRCRFPLPQQGEDGICSECGTLFDARATRVAWRSELNIARDELEGSAEENTPAH